MKKVLIFGVFDHLHKGHLHFFKQASRYGLVHVTVARDANVKNLKGNMPSFSERSRVQSVAKADGVYKAMLGGKDLNNPYQIIKKVRPDIICLGYDQRFFVKKLPEVISEYGLNTKIIRLKSHQPHIYKSSKIKKNRQLRGATD